MQNKKVIELFDKRFDSFTESVYKTRQTILKEVTPFNIEHARLTTLMDWCEAEAEVEDWIQAVRSHEVCVEGGVLKSYQVDKFVTDLQREKLDENMTLNTYQTLAARTINHDSNKEEHALHGMVGELGELHSIYQKVAQGHEFDEHHAMLEVGDLLWMMAEYCTANGWTLGQVAKANIDKLRKRYPNGFEAERSLNRDENDI